MPEPRAAAAAARPVRQAKLDATARIAAQQQPAGPSQPAAPAAAAAGGRASLPPQQQRGAGAGVRPPKEEEPAGEPGPAHKEESPNGPGNLFPSGGLHNSTDKENAAAEAEAAQRNQLAGTRGGVPPKPLPLRAAAPAPVANVNPPKAAQPALFPEAKAEVDPAEDGPDKHIVPKRVRGGGGLKLLHPIMSPPSSELLSPLLATRGHTHTHTHAGWPPALPVHQQSAGMHAPCRCPWGAARSTSPRRS